VTKKTFGATEKRTIINLKKTIPEGRTDSGFSGKPYKKGGPRSQKKSCNRLGATVIFQRNPRKGIKGVGISNNTLKEIREEKQR